MIWPFGVLPGLSNRGHDYSFSSRVRRAICFCHGVFRFMPVCERTGEPNGATRAKSKFLGARSITAVLGVGRGGSQEFFNHPNHRKGIGFGHNRANAHFMSVALQVGASMLGE